MSLFLSFKYSCGHLPGERLELEWHAPKKHGPKKIKLNNIQHRVLGKAPETLVEKLPWRCSKSIAADSPHSKPHCETVPYVVGGSNWVPFILTSGRRS